MCSRVLQTPKYLVKEEDATNHKISYKPLPPTGNVKEDSKFLNSRNGGFSIAFTQFCPEHATNMHPGATCKAWMTKMRQQAMAREARASGLEDAQKGRAEKNERAFKSREAARSAE
jgi:hypothetical protein